LPVSSQIRDMAGTLEKTRRSCGKARRIAASPLAVKAARASREGMSAWPLPPPMRAALDQAALAAEAGEVPVGAVVVRHGAVIAAAHNAPRAACDPTAHAEVLAIRAAARALGSERLSGCELWVTLEPCAMCAGAIVHARLARLYYAAPDPKGGAVEHGARVFAQAQCLHRPEVYSGMGEAEAAELLRSFFAGRR
jgi:tRNA(adenine34) deaminase